MKNLDWLDTGGGHIAVAFAVFLVGVGLMIGHVEAGKEVMVGAMASLYTSLRNAKQGVN